MKASPIILILILSAILHTQADSASLQSDNQTAVIKKEATGTSFTSEKFEAGSGQFLLNGMPFVVKAAELHYPRIPRQYWEHRIQMCKALGMNTICLYTFWNAHEPQPDNFDFDGQNDLRKFIKLCQKNGMYVILRPGPYVCAEWEMGGLPWWLLKKKDIRLRENDPYFLERVDKFQREVARQVKDLTIADGGPIIMVQVENEYGSYGIDKEYVGSIRDMLRNNFGDAVTLFQCDWSSNFLNNGLDDTIWTLNFGTGADIDSQFAPLLEVRPESPLMCSEFWSGWFDKWGSNHETRSANDMIDGISQMLDKGISFSLYMTHGGTNWGHWAGANSPGYAPDVTSYDYDAPINEQGAPTPKYFALRETLAKYSDSPLPNIPDTIPTIEIPQFTFNHVAPLFKNLPESVFSDSIITMESLNQGFGSILYRTSLPATSSESTLIIDEVHDFAQIFINSKYIGSIDRRLAQNSITLPVLNKDSQLDILVEAMGRINFGRAIKDYKGITQKACLVTTTNAGDTLRRDLGDWQIFPFPDTKEFYDSLAVNSLDSGSSDSISRLPIGVYKTNFNIDKPGDTFLNMESWGKGLVYVNGNPLGRFWGIGPQQTLYLPGCWLKEGENEILVFDIIGPKEAKIYGQKVPIHDKLNTPIERASKDSGSWDLSGKKPTYTGNFTAGNGWQKILFAQQQNEPNPKVKGRYVALECLNSHDEGKAASIAELYLLDGDGNRIPRESWNAVFVDSEDTAAGNHTADKAFDLQESTYWQTAETKPFPHMIVIDLGAEYSITGLEYLPRMESGAPHSIADFSMYIQ